MTDSDGTAGWRVDAYDDFAEAYAQETENNLLNRWYARSAILDLAGDVAGRAILDADAAWARSWSRCSGAAPA